MPVACVAVDETAAEKWVALTRRVSNSQIKSRISDKHLVRHLYDLYQLKTNKFLTGQYQHIVRNIMEKDQQQFSKYNKEYSDNPVNASKLAMDALFSKPKWRSHWQQFLQNMVYDSKKPSFEEACKQLKEISQAIFEAIEQPAIA